MQSLKLQKMTKQITLTDKEAEQEPEFPGTEATPVHYPKTGNGFNIDYIDWKGNPESCFIGAKTWDQARAVFERDVLHTLIVSHCPAIMTYDFD